jgi:carboxypeptidase Q
MRFLTGHRPWLAGAALTAGLALVPVSAQQPAPERIDYGAIYKIKDEGFQRSKVMETLSWLTDVYGPRLTNSPGFRKAGEWAVNEMNSWGLANAKLEPFPFGRGWSNEKFVMTATTPGGSFPVIGMATAWTPSTSGAVSGDAIFAPLATADDLAQFKGKLQGKVVFTQPLRDVAAAWTAPASRLTEKELEDLARESDAAPRSGRFGGRAGAPGRQGGPAAGRGGVQPFAQRLAQFLANEGALATVTTGARGDGGTLFVQGAAAASRQPNADTGLPAVVIAVEHYGRIVRSLQKDMPVRIDLEVRNTFHEETASFNVVAEIPGTDKADEVVMLGAHFDSWHGATGATDNAAGSAVMMEAMRILKASGLKLRRTVRVALWGGEEQGLIGSREYVTAHFANVTDMVLKPGHAKLSAYFNVDNGTGAIRGVYLQGNEAAAPIFDAWMKPFNNLGMSAVTIRDTGGTDHQSFDRVGLPGFQFIQDDIEYDTRTHHSNMDSYERIQEEDMRKNAVIVAAFAYNTANRDERLPRKPLPAAAGSRGRGTAIP